MIRGRAAGPAKVVEARAPTRIDFAGGTLDIWPLSLLHDDALTVNAAIDLHARARIEPLPDGFEIVSRDRDSKARFDTLEALEAAARRHGDALEFPARLAAHFLRRGEPAPCRVTTDCLAPAGSGLGGSSALGIALAAALDRFTAAGVGLERLLPLTQGIETQVLRIPTGSQDYHPALRGGALALHHTVEGTRVEKLPVDHEALRRRTVLVFSGVSRSSGISNWDMLKRRLDGDVRVTAALDAVNAAAHAMRDALAAGAWDRAGEALGREWDARRSLSDTVTTARIEELIAAARAAGAIAGKVCGAGGGGCLVFIVQEGRREAVEEKMAAVGARLLEFRFAAAGVEVTET